MSPVDLNISLLVLQLPYAIRSKGTDNQNLPDQLRELKDENSRLFKLLTEKELEIKHQKKKREEERLALAGINAPLLFTFELQ